MAIFHSYVKLPEDMSNSYWTWRVSWFIRLWLFHNFIHLWEAETTMDSVWWYGKHSQSSVVYDGFNRIALLIIKVYNDISDFKFNAYWTWPISTVLDLPIEMVIVSCVNVCQRVIYIYIYYIYTRVYIYIYITYFDGGL